MRWLIRRVSRRDYERGAVSVIVAVLLGCGVLTGLAAMVVDGGQIYAERAQMQNGADAAALAIAQACAASPVGAACKTDPGDPTTTAYAKANGYATGNANDGSGHISAVCGHDSSGAAPLQAVCPGGNTALYCPNRPSGNFVEVHTKTGTNGSNTLLPSIFGGAVLGTSYKGKTVGACAQASWGSTGSLGMATGLTISKCEWDSNTASGTQFAHFDKGPPIVWPPSFLDTLSNRTFLNNNGGTVAYKDPQNENVSDGPPGTIAATVEGSETLVGTHEPNTCAAGHPGWDAPGMFGWLTNSKTSCYVSITGSEYAGVGGNSAANCAQTFLDSRTKLTPIYIPVYTGINPATGNYILDGFAAFIVTGWDVTSGQSIWDSSIAPVKMPSIVSITDGAPTKDANYCGTFTGSSSDVCIYGFFTQKLIPASALPGGSGSSNLGANSVRLSG
jgi:Flp pilus assembly protein TadG